MASAAAAVPVFVRDTPAFVESATGRIAKYPRTAWARWCLRLGIAAPFIVLSVVFDRVSGGNWTGTANGALVERVGSLPWGSSSIDVIGQLYPLISSTLAVLIPGGALGLAIVGSLFGATLVQLVIQSLQRKGFTLSLRAVFGFTISLTPIFAYVVTTNFETTLGLFFIGLGLIDVVRFVTYANTQAGFRAGLLFAAAAFSDSTGLFSGLVAALAGSYIVRSRSGSRAANVIVLIFPTLSLLAALAVVGVAFRLGPLFMIRGDLSWDQTRYDAVMTFLTGPGGPLYLAPTLLVAIGSFLLRKPGVALSAAAVTVVTLLAYVLGLTPPGVAGVNYMIMLLLCVSIVPAARTIPEKVFVSGISVLLFTVGWLDALTTPALIGWSHLLLTGSPQ